MNSSISVWCTVCVPNGQMNRIWISSEGFACWVGWLDRILNQIHDVDGYVIRMHWRVNRWVWIDRVVSQSSRGPNQRWFPSLSIRTYARPPSHPIPSHSQSHRTGRVWTIRSVSLCARRLVFRTVPPRPSSRRTMGDWLVLCLGDPVLQKKRKQTNKQKKQRNKKKNKKGKIQTEGRLFCFSLDCVIIHFILCK